MHRLGPPRTMQDAPRYDDCAAEVAEHLQRRAAFALERGVAREAIVIDPGLGFGKRLSDNLDLVAAIGSLRSLGFPVLLGASRKSFLGALTGRAAGERDAATLAVTALAFQCGCELVRVHDAAASVDLVRVLAAARGGEPEEGAP
jgi:dihydropteroate synthase